MHIIDRALHGSEQVVDLAVANDTVEVLVEVDSGHHRSGVSPADAGDVAVAAARAGLAVVGVFTFPGHAYAPDARESATAAPAE